MSRWSVLYARRVSVHKINIDTVLLYHKNYKIFTFDFYDEMKLFFLLTNMNHGYKNVEFSER